MVMISELMKKVLTQPQVEIIMANPLYPDGLSGLRYDMITGYVNVAFGDEVRFRVAPNGRVQPPSLKSDSTLGDQLKELRKMTNEFCHRAEMVNEFCRRVFTILSQGQAIANEQEGDYVREI